MRKYLLAAVAMIAMTVSASSAEISVLSTTAMKEALTELAPRFEKNSGHKLNITWSSSSIIQKQIPQGGKFDLVITSAPDIETFISGKSVIAGSKVDFGRTGVAIAVKEGTPKIDVATADQVKTAILQAKAIAYSTGPSGLYVEKMIGNMGILDQVKPKMRQTPPGIRAAAMIVKGDADLGFQQMSEFIHEPGITIVGLLPNEIQNWTTWSTGIPTVAEQGGAAQMLQTFLARSGKVWKANGIEPLSR